MATKTKRNPPTPASVAKIATEKAALSRVALIGTFGSASHPGALVREENGDISRVEVGDTFDGGVVAAIGKDSLVLNRNGATKTLKLPRA